MISPHHGTPKGGNAFFNKCYTSHPPLKIKTDEGTFEVHGGSCIYPPVNVDVFVGLDRNMAATDEHYPWKPSNKVAFKFEITDMSVPRHADEFKNLIKYLVSEIKKGSVVYVGCIGGHGRTGMVLAAIYYQMTKDKNAIAEVRRLYCTKAVETTAQADWLAKHFGMDSHGGSKVSHRSGFGFGYGLDDVGSRPNTTRRHTRDVEPDLTKPNIHWK